MQIIDDADRPRGKPDESEYMNLSISDIWNDLGVDKRQAYSQSSGLTPLLSGGGRILRRGNNEIEQRLFSAQRISICQLEMTILATEAMRYPNGDKTIGRLWQDEMGASGTPAHRLFEDHAASLLLEIYAAVGHAESATYLGRWLEAIETPAADIDYMAIISDMMILNQMALNDTDTSVFVEKLLDLAIILQKSANAEKRWLESQAA